MTGLWVRAHEIVPGDVVLDWSDAEEHSSEPMPAYAGRGRDDDDRFTVVQVLTAPDQYGSRIICRPRTEAERWGTSSASWTLAGTKRWYWVRRSKQYANPENAARLRAYLEKLCP